MVDRTRLESGRTLTGTGSSNLPLSASISCLESITCILSTLTVADLLLESAFDARYLRQTQTALPLR